jgi:hypothetical protein
MDLRVESGRGGWMMEDGDWRMEDGLGDGWVG